jgi:hypothetical protein
MAELNAILSEAVAAAGAALPPIVEEPDGGPLGEGDDYDGEAVILGKPEKHDYVTFNVAKLVTVRLLARKPKVGYQPEYYYVPPPLRKDIAGDLLSFWVVPYFNHTSRAHGLYVARSVKDSADLKNNRYGRRLAKLFGESPSWHAGRMVRIWADTDNGTYKMKVRTLTEPVRFPDRTTANMLEEALGPTRYITDTSHPVYQEVLAGEDY